MIPGTWKQGCNEELTKLARIPPERWCEQPSPAAQVTDQLSQKRAGKPCGAGENTPSWPGEKPSLSPLFSLLEFQNVLQKGGAPHSLWEFSPYMKTQGTFSANESKISLGSSNRCEAVLASLALCGPMKLFLSPVSPHLKRGIVSSFRYDMERPESWGHRECLNHPLHDGHTWLQHFFRKREFSQNLKKASESLEAGLPCCREAVPST